MLYFGMSNRYLLEDYTADDEANEYYPSEYEINRERFAFDTAENEENEAEEDERSLRYCAEEFGVTVDFILDANEEYRRQCAYRAAVAYHPREETEDEISF